MSSIRVPFCDLLQKGFFISSFLHREFRQKNPRGGQRMKDLLSVKDMDAKEIIELLEMARRFRQESISFKKQIFVANMFFEPSTRTKMSFLVAERKLGLEPLEFHTETSSIKKGESLYDTARTFEAIGADVLVIRHQDDDWPSQIEGKLAIPIINAGAGTKDHPTQSLLDAYTIYDQFGTFKDVNVVIAGDIKHSRVAHSNAQILQRLGANIYVSGAPSMQDDELEFPYISIDEAIEKCDVLMLLRIQFERHEEAIAETDNYLQNYGLTVEREKQMKSSAIIMHPGPVNRGVEIASELVECDRSRIFTQMENGVYIRMAILTKLLLDWGIIHENEINQCKETAIKQRIRTV